MYVGVQGLVGSHPAVASLHLTRPNHTMVRHDTTDDTAALDAFKSAFIQASAYIHTYTHIYTLYIPIHKNIHTYICMHAGMRACIAAMGAGLMCHFTDLSSSINQPTNQPTKTDDQTPTPTQRPQDNAGRAFEFMVEDIDKDRAAKGLPSAEEAWKGACVRCVGRFVVVIMVGLCRGRDRPTSAPCLSSPRGSQCLHIHTNNPPVNPRSDALGARVRDRGPRPRQVRPRQARAGCVRACGCLCV